MVIFKKIFFLVTITLLINTLSSCATINSRQNNGFGHAYIATEQSAEMFSAANKYAFYIFFPVVLLTLPVTVLDLGISVITDTLLLPIDLSVEPDNPSRNTLFD